MGHDSDAGRCWCDKCRHKRELEDLRTQLAARTAEVERMREALEPFARIGDAYSIALANERWPTSVICVDLKLDDVRKARAALAPKEKTDG